jgi:hypothetical protein
LWAIESCWIAPPEPPQPIVQTGAARRLSTIRSLTIMVVSAESTSLQAVWKVLRLALAFA